MRSLHRARWIPDRIQSQNQRFFLIGSVCGISGTIGRSLYLVLSKEYYVFALIIGSTELVAHQILSVFLVGWQAGFQYHLLSLAVVAALQSPKIEF